MKERGEKLVFRLPVPKEPVELKGKGRITLRLSSFLWRLWKKELMDIGISWFCFQHIVSSVHPESWNFGYLKWEELVAKVVERCWVYHIGGEKIVGGG